MNLINKLNLIRTAKRHFEIGYFLIFLDYLSNRYKPIKVIQKNTGVPFVLNLSNMAYLSYLLENNWKIIDSTDTYVKMNGPKDENLYCRTQVGFDLGHIVEIFLSKDYGVDFNGKNVIDIGMSNGDSSIFFCKEWCKASDRYRT